MMPPLPGKSLRESPRLDESALRAIYPGKVRSGSFEALECLERSLAPGATWRRQRVAWIDDPTGERRGLCVNEVRVAPDSAVEFGPIVAWHSDAPVDFDAIENAYWQTCWATGALRLARGETASRRFFNLRRLFTPGEYDARASWPRLRELMNAASPDAADRRAFEIADRPVGDGALEPVCYLPARRPTDFLALDERLLAVTNAGYFLNFPEEYATSGALHLPVGAVVADGEMVTPPWLQRATAYQKADGRRAIGLLGPEELSLRLGYRNGDRAEFPLRIGSRAPDAPVTVWRGDEGPSKPAAGATLRFCGASLVSSELGTRRGEGNPNGGAAIRLDAECIRLGEVKDLGMGLRAPERAGEKGGGVSLRWALAAGPKLLEAGVPVPEERLFAPDNAGEFHADGPPPTRFPYDADRTRAPRTAIGLTAGGEWVVAVVDGRADPAHSVGATLLELARLAAALGCHEALNLDGGGSSVLAVRDLAPEEQVAPGLTPGVAGLPSDVGAQERIVPVALGLRRREG